MFKCTRWFDDNRQTGNLVYNMAIYQCKSVKIEVNLYLFLLDLSGFLEFTFQVHLRVPQLLLKQSVQ